MMSDDVKTSARELGSKHDADVLIYNGPIGRPLDDEVIDLCRNRARRKNVFLILTTEGGDPDAAYRISRYLQHSFEKFTCIVNGYCKSAGTLIVTGAHELAMSHFGELGPLDVQMSKRDNLTEMQSTETISAALKSLTDRTFSAFEYFFLDIQKKSGGRVTLPTAADIAAKLTVGVFGPIYQQLDPMHIGETVRVAALAEQYGTRLSRIGKNLRDRALTYLVGGYGSHGFVIDVLDAKVLFNNMRNLSMEETRLCDALGPLARIPQDHGYTIQFLTEAPQGQKEKGDGKTNNESRAGRVTKRLPRKPVKATTAGSRPNGLDAAGIS